MYNIKVVIDKINNDNVNYEELLFCLKQEKLGPVGVAIFKLIERKYDSEEIINRLVELSPLLTGHKFSGPYQFGHAAISLLFLINSNTSLSKYNEIYDTLNDSDKFLVDNFIKNYS